MQADQPIDVGERTLDAITTPGHTQGHFVFADRAAGLLFAGDHVLPTITPSIGFEPLLDHHDVRLRGCLDALTGRSRTALEVATSLPWTRHERAFADLDVFNAALAALETRAHLELLVVRGALSRVVGDDEVRYSPRTIGA